MLAYLILVFVLGTLGYQSFERTVLYMLLVIGAAAITAAGE